MLIPGFLLQHEVVVEPYQGDSAYGPVYAGPVTVRCWLERKRRRVKDAQGREVVSEATFWCRLDAVDAPPESKVTLPGGRQTTVIVQAPYDPGGLPAPSHLEVSLV